MDASLSPHNALRQGVGYHQFPGRSLIEILGADRAKVLHGLCTHDINRLVPGSGCEAFLTNVQGRTIGFAYVSCRTDSLLLDTAPGYADTIIPALDRYVIREDVRFVDRSADTATVLISGARAVDCLQELCEVEPPSTVLSHRPATARSRIAPQGGLPASPSDIPIEICRVPYASPVCFFLRCNVDSIATLCEALESHGAARCAPEAIEAARIEMGTPVFGIDITPDNLPQEVGRDRQAISFNKGCYLGQETVARIDALGHVNQTLLGLKFAGDRAPPPGTSLAVDNKPAARVTSACWSPTLQAPLALAYVRRGHDQIGKQFATEFGKAEVVALPVG